MGRTNSILTSITGGQAYTVVLPIPIKPSALDVPIAAENRGDHILTGVTITLYKSGVWMPFTHEENMQSVRDRLIINTLHPKERFVLNREIRPETLLDVGEEEKVCFFAPEQPVSRFGAAELLSEETDPRPSCSPPNFWWTVKNELW